MGTPSNRLKTAAVARAKARLRFDRLCHCSESGMSKAEAAEELGMHPESVNRLLRNMNGNQLWPIQ